MQLLTINKLEIEKSAIENNIFLSLDIIENPCERNSHCMLKLSEQLYIL